MTLSCNVRNRNRLSCAQPLLDRRTPLYRVRELEMWIECVDGTQRQRSRCGWGGNWGERWEVVRHGKGNVGNRCRKITERSGYKSIRCAFAIQIIEDPKSTPHHSLSARRLSGLVGKSDPRHKVAIGCVVQR